MRLKTRGLEHALYAGTLFVLASCGGGGPSEQNEATASSTPAVTQLTTQIDLQAGSQTATQMPIQIMDAIYQDVRMPDQFYQEPQRDPGLYYLIKHVKSSVLGAPTSSFELCTDDFNEALNWSELDNSQSNVYRNLIGNMDNEIYFEFTRASSTQPTLVQFNRIFKCSNLNRDPSLFGGAQESIGIYNNLLSDKEQFKKTVEYLWYISPKNNYGYSVLESNAAETTENFQNTIRSAHLIINGSTNQKCDLINVEQFEYTANKATGIISMTRILLSSFYAKYSNNISQLCLDPSYAATAATITYTNSSI